MWNRGLCSQGQSQTSPWTRATRTVSYTGHGGRERSRSETSHCIIFSGSYTVHELSRPDSAAIACVYGIATPSLSRLELWHFFPMVNGPSKTSSLIHHLWQRVVLLEMLYFAESHIPWKNKCISLYLSKHFPRVLWQRNPIFCYHHNNNFTQKQQQEPVTRLIVELRTEDRAVARI